MRSEGEDHQIRGSGRRHRDPCCDSGAIATDGSAVALMGERRQLLEAPAKVLRCWGGERASTSLSTNHRSLPTILLVGVAIGRLAGPRRCPRARVPTGRWRFVGPERGGAKQPRPHGRIEWPCHYRCTSTRHDYPGPVEALRLHREKSSAAFSGAIRTQPCETGEPRWRLS